MNENLARRGKALMRIAFRCFAIAVVLSIGGGLLSLWTHSSVAWAGPVVAVPVCGGGLLALHWSTKWHREFMHDGPWASVEDLIASASATLFDLEAGFPHRATQDGLSIVLHALCSQLERDGDRASATQLAQVLDGIIELDGQQVQRIRFILVTIKDGYATNRWQKERLAWEKAWKDA